MASQPVLNQFNHQSHHPCHINQLLNRLNNLFNNLSTCSTSSTCMPPRPPAQPPAPPPLNRRQVVGFAGRYDAVGDKSAAGAVTNFFRIVTEHHSYATGGSNDHEVWGGADQLADAVYTVREGGLWGGRCGVYGEGGLWGGRCGVYGERVLCVGEVRCACA